MKIPETAKSKTTQSSFNNDAKKLWNKIPQNIKDCPSLYMAKKAIRQFVKTLPV